MGERRLKLETGAREEDERDDSPRGGFLHRTRHLRGWSKWVHGFNCPRCGASCHDRRDRAQHDSWHRDDDQAWDEWTEELTDIRASVEKIEHRIEEIERMLGPRIAWVLSEKGE